MDRDDSPYMKLTRRDALLALAGGGLVASAAIDGGTAGKDGTVSEGDLETLVALAEVLYPSSVAVTREFVETYSLGRKAVDEEYLARMSEALEEVRTTSRLETGRAYASLGPDLRDEVLRATGADRAYADPEGTVAQRVRYYVVDELLYAFYATPKGAEFVGSRNPVGYPGGTEAYQQRPEGGQ
jgi:hypothetical protein